MGIEMGRSIWLITAIWPAGMSWPVRVVSRRSSITIPARFQFLFQFFDLSFSLPQTVFKKLAVLHILILHIFPILLFLFCKPLFFPLFFHGLPESRSFLVIRDFFHRLKVFDVALGRFVAESLDTIFIGPRVNISLNKVATEILIQSQEKSVKFALNLTPNPAQGLELDQDTIIINYNGYN